MRTNIILSLLILMLGYMGVAQTPIFPNGPRLLIEVPYYNTHAPAIIYIGYETSPTIPSFIPQLPQFEQPFESSLPTQPNTNPYGSYRNSIYRVGTDFEITREN